MLYSNTLRLTLNQASRKSFQSAVALTTSVKNIHTLPDLPYDYGALEPAISGRIMEIHHTKHHATYVNNLNAAEEALDRSSGDVVKQIAIHSAHKFHGGGHINHSIFWTNLAPVSQGGGQLAEGSLKSAIEKEFASVDGFKTEFMAKAAALQGSGWIWLALNPANNGLCIAACANQDPLQPTTGLIPLLGVDMWEHAYYLQYKNMKPDYLKSFWGVVNWKNVEERYTSKGLPL